MPDRPGDPLAALAAREQVSSAMAAARDAVDVLLRDRGLRRTESGDTVESLLRGAAASAALEGSLSSAAQVRAGEGDPVAVAALRVSGELVGLLPGWRRAPVQTLARLHVLAAEPPAAESPSTESPSALPSSIGPSSIGPPSTGPSSTEPEDARGRPVSASGAQRLHGVATLVRTPTTAPAMLVAAVVHAEIATAEAFGSRDGLVARAAERLVLIATGVDPASVTVPEAGHARSPQAYAAALAGYRDGGPGGVVRWLLHAAAAYAYGVEASALRDDSSRR